MIFPVEDPVEGLSQHLCIAGYWFQEKGVGPGREELQFLVVRRKPADATFEPIGPHNDHRFGSQQLLFDAGHVHVAEYQIELFFFRQ